MRACPIVALAGVCVASGFIFWEPTGGGRPRCRDPVGGSWSGVQSGYTALRLAASIDHQRQAVQMWIWMCMCVCVVCKCVSGVLDERSGCCWTAEPVVRPGGAPAATAASWGLSHQTSSLVALRPEEAGDGGSRARVCGRAPRRGASRGAVPYLPDRWWPGRPPCLCISLDPCGPQ